MTNERRAALFDLDRTIVRKDTAHLYTRYRRAQGEATLRDVLRVGWWMMQYTMGVIDAPRVARKALEKFAGKSESWLEASCEELFITHIKPLLMPGAKARVAEHRAAGDLVAIVTGATRYVADPVARELGIPHVVCTELEVDAAGLFTGHTIDPICYGEGKIVRARRLLDSHQLPLSEAIFFSDSITDLPLLSAVKTPVVVNPDRRLRNIARARAWPIEIW